MDKMGNQAPKSRILSTRLNSLYKGTAVAAALAGILLLIGLKILVISVLPLGSMPRWFSAFPDNWLIIIFKLHAGFNGIQLNVLEGLNILDIVLLLLAGIMYIGLYAALRRTSIFWSIIALIQPFLGIVLFIVTRSAGRSAMMGAALVISLAMLKSTTFNKPIAFLGIAASILLLIGDFSAGIPPSIMIASLFGIAYILVIVWFFLVALTLFQLSSVFKDGK
jgi:hypothetical protein